MIVIGRNDSSVFFYNRL